MFGGQTEVSFIALKQNKNTVANIANAGGLTTDLLEITSVKSDGTEIKMTNMSKCSANISFVAPLIPKGNAKKHACYHLNEGLDKKEFVFNQGCYVDQVIDISSTQQ